MEKDKYWYGFDLDGTLAKRCDRCCGYDKIGSPVSLMVDLAKLYHSQGKIVKLVTSRGQLRPDDPPTMPNPYIKSESGMVLHNKNTGVITPAIDDDNYVREMKKRPWLFKKDWEPLDFVHDWCDTHLGFVPEVTAAKDSYMIELYDDRVKQVEPNEGWILEEDYVRVKNAKEEWRHMYKDECRKHSETRAEYLALRKKMWWPVIIMGFAVGCNLIVMIACIIHKFLSK